MNVEGTVWFNQHVMSHKDLEYGSQTTLEIMYSSQTTDFQSYGAPYFNIALSTTTPVYIRKIISLNYQNASDLLVAIGYLFQSFSKNGFPTSSDMFELVKRYHRDKLLKFNFFVYGNGDKVCSITIQNSGSDFLVIHISFDLFRCVCNLVKNFVTDYYKLASNILTQSQTLLLSKVLESNENMTKILKSLNFQNNTKEEPIPPELIESVDRMNEFDNFLGKDMQNIVIPEITQTPTVIEKSKTDHGNSLVNTVLKNNLKVLENLITSSFTAFDPIETIQERICRELDYDSNFLLLPGISEDEMKSYKFLSKLFYLYRLHKFSLGNNNIPEIKLLVYNPTNVDSKNISISYDLFVIFVYLRIFISKMSRREPNVHKNKIAFYTGFRCIFDMMTLSFINSLDINKVKSCILERFETYTKSGFFNEYTQLLETVSIPPISSKDFSDAADQLLVKLTDGPLKVIKDLHNELYEKGKEIVGIDLRIPFINNLNLEQILNILQIQLTFALGQFDDVKDDKVSLAKKISEIVDISDGDLLHQIVTMFVDKKIDIEKKTKERETNLLRACKFYISDVPVSLQKEFLEYIESITTEKYDWDKFSIEEFKDNIVKVLYIWNENDSKILYSDFMSKVENCVMNKDLILVKNRMVDLQTDQDTNFDLGAL